MVEAVPDSTNLLQTRSSDEARAPSTIMLCKMVPLPRAARGEG